MIARNFLLVLLTVGVGTFALLIFFISFFKGLFENPQAQALLIFDERDLKLRRPWESAIQLGERQKTFGTLIEPSSDEWGGAND